MRRSRTLCYAWAAMLSVRTPGSSRRVADLTRLFASFLAENYTVYWPETIRSRERPGTVLQPLPAALGSQV